MVLMTNLLSYNWTSSINKFLPFESRKNTAFGKKKKETYQACFVTWSTDTAKTAMGNGCSI